MSSDRILFTSTLSVTMLCTFLVFGSCFVASSDSVLDMTMRYIREPEDFIVRKHDTVILNCLAVDTNGSAVSNVSWRKEGLELAVNERIRIHANGSLEITGFTQSDEGVYDCVATSQFAALSSRQATLTLAVLDHFSSQPQNTTVEQGYNVRFQCRIDGHPKPEVNWVKDGQKLPQTDRIVKLPFNVLHIVNVTSDSSGVYRCHASNSAKNRTSEPARLTVIESHNKMAVQMLAGPVHQVVVAGQSVVFECLLNVKGPVIKWIKKGTDGPLPEIRTRMIGTNLEIERIDISDAGIYICSVEDYPEISAEASLNVLVPPYVSGSNDENITVNRAQTIRMLCEFMGHPSPTVTWMKNGQLVSSYGRVKQQGMALTIFQSTDVDSGLYQCWAENQAGRIASVKSLHVIYSEDYPDPPTGVTAEALSSKGIKISWNLISPKNHYNIVAYSVHYWPTQGGEENQIVALESPVFITKLLPHSNYTFYVRTYNDRGASIHSNYIIQATNEDVPLSAPGCRLYAESSTSLKVDWDRLTPDRARGVVIGHKIFYKQLGHQSENILEVDGNVHSYVIDDLISNQRYDVRVLSGTKVGYPQLDDERWPWVSHIVSEKVNIGVTPLTNVVIRVLNSTCISITWDTPESLGSELLGFKIMYKIAGSDEEPRMIVLVEEIKEHILYSLQPETTYEIGICSFTDLGEGEIIQQNVRTPGNPPLPSPHYVTAQPLNETAIKLTWSEPLFRPDQITHYTVCYGPCDKDHLVVNCNSSAGKFINTTSLGVVIPKLLPITEYHFAVQSHSQFGHSSFGDTVRCRTGLPPPEQIRWFLISPTDIQLSWQMPRHLTESISLFVVIYTDCPESPESNWLKRTENGSVYYTILRDLKSRTKYSVRLHAETHYGQTPLSEILQIVTGEIPESGRINDRALGIIIGVCISLCCIVGCIIIIVMRNRCFPRTTTSTRLGSEHAQFRPHVTCNGCSHTPVIQSNGFYPVPQEDATVIPKLNHSQEDQVSNAKGLSETSCLATHNDKKFENGVVNRSNSIV